MDEMDIDQVVDIPDTPDRLAARHINGLHHEKEGNSLAVGNLRNSDIVHEESLNQMRARNSYSGNLHNRRLHSYPGIKPIDLEEFEPRTDSVYDNSHPSQNGSLFRKSAIAKSFKHETGGAIGARTHHLDKGKAVCSKVPSRLQSEEDGHKLPETRHAIGGRHMNKGKAVQSKVSSKLPVCKEHDDFFDFIEGNEQKLPEIGRAIGSQHFNNGKAIRSRVPPSPRLSIRREHDDFLDVLKEDEHKKIFDTAFPRRGSNDLQSGNVADGQVLSNYGSKQFAPASSWVSGSAFKGKEKMDVNTCNGSGSAVNHGKRIDHFGGSEHKVEKLLSASHQSVTSPRVVGQKRLVRNGCISPHNIATRTQKKAESHQIATTTAESNLDVNGNEVSDGPSHVDIREIVAEDNNYSSVKGKWVIIQPSTLKKHDAKVVHVSTSSSAINNGATNGMGNVTGDALSNGWRRTHNHIKKINNPLHTVRDADDGYFTNELHESRMVKEDNGRENVTKTFGCEGYNVSQTASRQVSRVDQNVLSKRPKKHGLTSGSHGECSTLIHDDSEISFLGSFKESSSSRLSRIQNRQHEGSLAPIYEIDELSPEMRNNSQGFNDDSDYRARQVEADEMLARELQEQLYNETPIFGGGEIDETVAWALQQEEGVYPAASSQNHPVSRLRSSSRTNRQPRPRTFQNPSNGRVPNSRTSQLRNRLFYRTPTAVPRGRNRFRSALSGGGNFEFPLDMDLDMRLDILEALEAAVEDFDDMSMAGGHMLQLQRDFIENDYEMLLALDDNNHQHGVSANQINGLPESVVQTDNFEETCAICLETPSLGESIRHLPCLHKFHKDCIDPWLRRKTSCPVCKSSVT